MKKEKIIERLNEFKTRLAGEVSVAYKDRGSSYGKDRFFTWKRKFREFLKLNIPGQEKVIDNKLNAGWGSINVNASDFEDFWRNKGDKMLSFIDSLILDIQNDELDIQAKSNDLNKTEERALSKSNDSVFIVHGHDGETKTRTARFVEKLDLKAIILHEQANQGMTIIEKIENHTNVGFGIVLYTPDDMGSDVANANKCEYSSRARQNVVFEHGFLMAKIGRSNVVPLVTDSSIELPSDISGMVYISDKTWEIDIAKEMKAAGYDIDLNKLF